MIKRYACTGTIKSANKIPKIKPAIPNDNIEAHGLSTRLRSKTSADLSAVTWKSLDINVKRKLKKYGFNKNSELNPTLIACITKKIEKKKLKKGVKNVL